MRIKDEIRFLHQKKEQLNKELYKAHLQASAEWGTVWYIIQNSINDSTRIMMDGKYKTLKQKIEKLTEQNTKHTSQEHTFTHASSTTPISNSPKGKKVLCRKALNTI